MSEKFRVNDLVKFNYSEIVKYVDENHTDRPLRNDEVCDLLNKQQVQIKVYEESLIRKSKKISEQQDTIEQLHLAIDDLLSHTSCEEIKKENEQLKKECKIAIDEMVTDYKKLEKENEQLQKELQRFKKYVFSQDNILCYKCEHCIKKDIYVVDCEMKGEVDVHGLCSLFRDVKV